MPQSTPQTASRFLPPFLPLFLQWYWFRRPSTILRDGIAFVGAIGETFSILFLLKTLFAPWKSITDAYPKNMFDFAAIFETLVFNVVARCVGATIRLMTILLGSIILLTACAVVIVWLALWIAFPFLLVAGSYAILAGVTLL